MSIVRTRFSFQDASLIRSDDVPHALCNQHDVWQCSHEEIKSQDRLTAATLPLHQALTQTVTCPVGRSKPCPKKGEKFLRPPNIVGPVLIVVGIKKEKEKNSQKGKKKREGKGFC